MRKKRSGIWTRTFASLAAALSFVITGCHYLPQPSRNLQPPAVSLPVGGDLPRELSKVVLPTYTVEPPDILVVEALNIAPKPPYHLQPQDVLAITARGTLSDAPIQAAYSVEPGGILNFGLPYGSVKVAGMTTEEAKTAIEAKLRELLAEPEVSVSLLQLAAKQQISGQHLVGPDGTITLGSYGSVHVVGMTLGQAKEAIELHLSQELESPQVSVDVFSYNSKVYYVISEGAGLGDDVARFPITGNETVLDAIANVNGLTQVSSKRIWVARPTPSSDDLQILPVNWQAITGQGQTATNYQILPGDRVFVAEDSMIALDTRMAKFFAPWERLMGFALLATGTATRHSGKVLGGGGDQRRAGL